jgi:xanthine/CO dehydrogenase XdhC/CoxF family maturation factor
MSVSYRPVRANQLTEPLRDTLKVEKSTTPCVVTAIVFAARGSAERKSGAMMMDSTTTILSIW